MATIHANTQLKTGDIVNGLSGLKDCESGRCLNLRLDGKAVAPEGWPSVCQPPHVRYFYVNLNLHEHNPSVPPYKSLQVDVATKQEAVNLLKQFYAGYSDSNFGCAEEPITKSFAEALERYSVCHTQRQLCTPDRKSKVWCSGGVFARFCPRENAPDVCKGKTTWPKETCSELIYYAASGRFKPACAQHDPNLPDSLKNERRCLSLCDAEGNCVIIRKTERGIELWQEKYKQRALIDPATGKVLGVKQDSETAKLKLTSLTEATLPANRQRTTIGVGEVVTVTTNQPVTWTISGSLVYKRQETSTSFTFMAQHEVGSILITAQTECEMQQLSFQVIGPYGINYELDSVNKHGSLVPRIYHKKGGYEFVVGLRMTLLPTSVNFGNLFFNEIDSASIDTGVFNDGKVHCHISGSQPRGSICKGFHELRVHDENGKHNIIGAFDVVGGGENDPRKIRNLPDISEMRLRIETQWRVMTNLRRKTMGDTVEQMVRLHNNGQMYVMKGNFSMTINKDDSFEDRRVIEDMVID